MKRTHVALLLTAGLAVAVGVPLATAGGDAPAPATSPSSKMERAPEPVAALKADPDVAPAATEESAAASNMLLLPDGTSVPTLNGAVGAAPLAQAWSPQVPWSPIVGVERSSAGVDWYVHADGTRSTTEMKWRQDLGREDALTRVAHPGPTPPEIRR